MEWQRSGADAQVSADGYRVQAVRHAECWLYVAWGPERGDTPRDRRVRYARGEPVPQSRELLGVAATADDARALCAAHRAGPPRE